MFAQRMSHIESSNIRKMFEMAAKMKNPINFSLGLPDFDVPESVKEVAIQAIRDGKNGYMVTAGIPEFKQAVSQSLLKEGIKPQEVMAVSGASGGLALSFMVLADEQTEVLIPDPCFVAYGHLAKMASAKVRWLSTYPDLKLTPAKLEKAILASQAEAPQIKNRIFLFNSPVNPTGVAYTANEIQEFIKITQKYQLQVIVDEVYDRFCYDFPHESWLKFDSSAVLVRTFGKTWGMTGWRAGYVAGPQNILDQMMTLQQFTYVCLPAPIQLACVEALKTSVEEQIQRYKKKRDFVFEKLAKFFNLIKPQGAFYAFPEAPQGDMAQFLKKCLENEILIVPGKAFSQQNTHFRLSFALSDEQLESGLEKLCQLV